MRRNPAEALPLLLDYVPFADDPAVEDEVLSCLAQLALQQPSVPAALRAALKDELPAKRGAAALVLGLVGEKADVAAVRPLLEDGAARVRLHAAQGLLACRERAAVPVLVALLGEGTLSEAIEAEDVLRQIAGEQAPATSVADPNVEARRKGHDAWEAWWLDHGDRLDLTRAVRERPYLGLTLVAEMAGGRRGGGSQRAWEFGRDDKARWEVTDAINPIDARILPGNRVLIAEYNVQKVTERDLGTKQVVWEYKTNGIVVSCQRLSNGNTFIATYNAGLMEVTPGGKEIYHINPLANAGGVVNALKLRNGQIACMTAQGQLMEMDITGKTTRTTMLDPNGGWNGLEELPGGRLLVALQVQGKVMELDANRKSVWECPAPGAVHAVPLNNGHVLVACGNLQKLLEVDHNGKVVWDKATNGRPFHVRRR
jgi:hypothetical protein